MKSFYRENELFFCKTPIKREMDIGLEAVAEDMKTSERNPGLAGLRASVGFLQREGYKIVTQHKGHSHWTTHCDEL